MDLCAANGRLQPGFRFHPTNVELVMYYLKRKVLRKGLRQDMVNEVDVYKFHPKDLRDLAKKDLNWYFFCPRGKKYGSGERTNRATDSGYWKATGNDRVVSYEDRPVGKIKTLVFHEGKPPKGTRTDWVMHEYRLEDKKLADAGVGQDSYVLCKIFEKSGWGPKNAEQYGAPFVEEEWEDEDLVLTVGDPSTSAVSNVVESLIEYYPAATSEQAVSVSNVYQAPTPIANATDDIPSGWALDQMLAPMSAAVNLVSYSMDPMVSNVMMPMAADNPDIVSASAAPAPTSEEDEMNRLLDMFMVGDENNVFEGLDDLDNMTFNGVESSWENFDNGGFYLSELDEPLIPGGYCFN